jgi:hypothetical protein
MNNKLKSISSSVLLFIIIILCVSCSQLENISSETSLANFRNLYETSKPGTFQMSYDGFDGSVTKTFNVNKGDKVTFIYDSSVKEGALSALSMTIYDPYGTSIASLPVNKKGSFKIVAIGTGKISMVIIGKNTTGSFEILWK